MTNGERIRLMTDEELLDRVMRFGRCAFCPDGVKCKCIWMSESYCRDISLKWLKEQEDKR